MVPVVFASDMRVCEGCDEPYCPKHDKHYADCPCVGPSQTDDYDYSADGKWAWPKPKQRGLPT